MRERYPDYPPEYDMEEPCMICGVDCSDCDCDACPKCTEVGNPDCYTQHGMPVAHDSVGSLLDHLGLSTKLSETFRAVERHSLPCVGYWITLRDGTKYGSPETTKRSQLDEIPHYTRIKTIGVSGIAWDGSDWEWYEEAPAGNGWKDLHDLESGFEDALKEHEAEMEAEND